MTTTDNIVDPDLLAMMRAVVAPHAPTPRDLGAAGVAFDAALWSTLDDLGLALLTAPESVGGSAAGWPEAAALLSVCAAEGVLLPLAEHDLLGTWLQIEAGLPVSTGHRRTVALVDADGHAHGVPWAAEADELVVARPYSGAWRVTTVPTAGLALATTANLVGEPRSQLVLSEADLATHPGVDIDPEGVSILRLRGALVRAVQIAAVLERCLDLTIEHVSTREQFGRPLARFQAVQQLVADMAAETSIARTAVDVAVTSIAAGAAGDETRFRVAVARSIAGHAASIVVRHAHQLHGAIGTTLEHPLHRATLAALAWRSEFGTTAYWDSEVATLADQAQSLWARVSS